MAPPLAAPLSRAIRLAEAGFATIALLLCAKVFASQVLTNRTQRRTDELFVSVSRRIDQITELNELLASLHADVQQVMPRTLPADVERLSAGIAVSESRFRAITNAYDAEDDRRQTPREEVEDFYRIRAVARVYFGTALRLVALLQRGNSDAARVLLHDALEPTRVREAVIAARMLRRYAARMHSLHGALGQTYRATFQVDLVASLAVLALLLVVRRVVMLRLVTEDDQRARNIVLLAERNRDLDDFAHRIAHDLKGLVNPVSGYASLISENPDDRERVVRYAERIARKSDEVVRMVDELLRLARAGNVSRGPTQPAAVVTAVVEQFEAEVAGIGATMDVACADVALDLGEIPLREVVQNLVQNALKYRAPERTLAVHVTLVDTGEGARLTVRDNGLGMLPSVAARAHEPFFRGATERDVPGSGLGLAIVHRIATAHGGALDVESAIGSGTSVTVTLPRWTPPG